MPDPAPSREATTAIAHLSFDTRRVDASEDTLPRFWLADPQLMRSLPPAAWTLFRLAEYKRGGTATHMWRVGALAWRFAQSLGMSAIKAQALGLAAALHDTGKLCIPNSILEKPGRLSPDEILTMRMHPQLGAEMLTAIGGAACELAATVARTHHERYDGTGYPYGLSGNRIPLAGRIVALVDVFDALASHRPYRAALSPAQIVGAMLAERGRHFDPWLLDRFLEQSLSAALEISSGAH
ncbi:response regulator receiver [Pandoraea aquatica]|uniref:Response regulator receiver n=1 Tax=Pandoraea aquatica TaxID=2508290 RepID=A0A5E4VLW8_9BURK|nr:HD domain-containing phosphohydrolase [Pandoraea aquatica]VVE12010.1 response regulator receiver [Pandoraea aquatica]